MDCTYIGRAWGKFISHSTERPRSLTLSNQTAEVESMHPSATERFSRIELSFSCCRFPWATRQPQLPLCCFYSLRQRGNAFRTKNEFKEKGGKERRGGTQSQSNEAWRSRSPLKQTPLPTCPPHWERLPCDGVAKKQPPFGPPRHRKRTQRTKSQRQKHRIFLTSRGKTKSKIIFDSLWEGAGMLRNQSWFPPMKGRTYKRRRDHTTTQRRTRCRMPGRG